LHLGRKRPIDSMNDLRMQHRCQGPEKDEHMPVYEFQCKCGHITEELVRMDTRSVECPKCHGKANKILSACSFELKGGGWYADGYASTKK